MAITKVTSRVLENNSVGVAQLSAGAVTLDKLTTSIQQALLPVGAVQAFAKTTAPAGWLSCNGDAVLTTGTVQGVAASSLTDLRNMLLADSSPFGLSSGNPLLPDLRGYFIRGSGTNSDGTAAGTFGLKQSDALKEHTHNVSGNTGDRSNGHTHTFNTSTNTTGGHRHFTIRSGTGSNAQPTSSTTESADYAWRGALEPNVSLTNTAGDHAHSVSGTTDGENTGHYHGININSGNPSTGVPGETRPKNIALLYCIKY